MRGHRPTAILALAAVLAGCTGSAASDTSSAPTSAPSVQTTTSAPEPDTTATSAATSSTPAAPPTTLAPAGGALTSVELEASPVDVAGIPSADAAINWTWFNDHVIVEDATLTRLISSVVDSRIGGGPFNLEFDERLFYEFTSPLTRGDIVRRLQQAIAPDLQWLPDVAAGDGAVVAREGDGETFAHEYGIQVEEVDGHWSVGTSFMRLIPADEFPAIPYFGNIDEVWGMVTPTLPGTVTPSGFWANVRFEDARILMGYDLFLYVDRTVPELVEHAAAQGWAPLEDNPDLYATGSLGTFQFFDVGPETTQVIVYGWTSELPVQG